MHRKWEQETEQDERVPRTSREQRGWCAGSCTQCAGTWTADGIFLQATKHDAPSKEQAATVHVQQRSTPPQPHSTLALNIILRQTQKTATASIVYLACIKTSIRPKHLDHRAAYSALRCDSGSLEPHEIHVETWVRATAYNCLSPTT